MTLGTFGFLVRVDDSGGRVAQKNFSITIDPQALTITNDSTLPRARVGAPYLNSLMATGGTPPYRNWRIVEGQLPASITLSNSGQNGLLSGTPSVFGAFSFTIAVSDGTPAGTVSKRFTLVVDPAALTITTQSPLPLGTVASSYQRTLTASGGPTPYSWEVNGSLPSGLTLNASTGVLSGTPSAVGLFSFEVQVTDDSNAVASRSFSLAVADSRATVALEGEQGPGQQAAVNLTLAAVHPFPIAGQLEVSFQPDTLNNSDDGTIRFSNNLRTAQFTVAAGSAEAQFAGGDLAMQTGTTAGLITLRVTALQTGSQAIPPAADAKLDVTIPQSPPAIGSAAIQQRTGTGFSVEITGFTTARQVTGAVFQFTAVPGRTLQNTQATVDLNGSANAWYQNPSSAATGGAFVYTQPFTIQGDLSALQSVAVTLTNSRGDSQSATVNF
jgi:hypothetical protein